MLTRRKFVSSVAGAALLPTASFAQTSGMAEAHDALIFKSGDALVAAVKAIQDRGNADMAAGLILALRFSRTPPAIFGDALNDLTGQDLPPDWNAWMLWQEANPEIVPHASYAVFKRKMYLAVDPNFEVFLKPEHLRRDAMKIRLEEITWGGVRKDGIPSLDFPELVGAEEATYLQADDLVFGVSINGDVRAYPLRIMGWHEMFNEVIGGVPVALAYCTLCGSGILFETQLEGRDKPLIFGSSGFLYRSNKLMFDRETHSLWNQFTGKPVSGTLVDSGIELTQRPVVITTWENWIADNPDTQVITLDTGFRRNYGSGAVYSDYFSSSELMFPTLVDQSTYKQKDYVFGVCVKGGAKAWPLDVFAAKPVINDEVAGDPIVLIGDAKTRTVRAYWRKQNSFLKVTSAGLHGEAGGVWVVSEEQITASTGEALSRVAGHIAYWFAWNGYLADVSEIY